MAFLGVNIDHIANVREARKTIEPDPVQFAFLAELGGADSITVHLREDRRHIQDRDLFLLKQTIKTKLNLEMAATSEMSKIAKEVGSIVVVDNTFLSPILQKPLELGADLVLHSTTKFINGHSDVVGGAVIGKNQELVDHIFWLANCLGLTGSPFDSFLTLRGLRTITPRLEVHQKNTKEIIDFLSNHPSIEKIHYPGLKNHPGHQIAKKQQKGYGSLFSVEIKGGIKKVKSVISNLKLFSLAESLGGVESLIAHPETMTHAGMALNARRDAGITEGLLRISVGIENSSDLIQDLDKALSTQNSYKRINKPKSQESNMAGIII